MHHHVVYSAKFNNGWVTVLWRGAYMIDLKGSLNDVYTPAWSNLQLSICYVRHSINDVSRVYLTLNLVQRWRLYTNYSLKTPWDSSEHLQAF